MNDKICLPPEKVRHLIYRFEEYIIKTRAEMDYLEKALKEIKKDLKEKKIR